MGQRLTTMTSGQKSFPVAPSIFSFAQHGKSGAWISDLLPHTATVADRLCFIRSMHTEAINHDPAITFLQTGSQQPGRPSLGAWLSYGLGSENKDLPSYVVLTSKGTGRPDDQPLYDRLWGSGFLPTRYQGVKFRSTGDPVLFLSNPPGVDESTRRQMLGDLKQLNERKLEQYGDPEIATRIAQYELAYRMQMSVPELTDISGESAETLAMYGIGETATDNFGRQCLMARRMSEAGVRFVQVTYGDNTANPAWDQHSNMPKHKDHAVRIEGFDGFATDINVQGMSRRVRAVLPDPPR